MSLRLWERFKYWVCDTFGHKDLEFSHTYANKHHYTCKFCGRMESKPVRSKDAQ